MPNTDLLISFLLATAVFAYMPGPAMIYATAQTIGGGKRAGWMAALGIHVGGYVHVFAAAFGLALLFQAVPSIYVFLKLVGAAYLVWLGIGLFRAKVDTSEASEVIKPKSASKAFVASAMVEIFNPKTALFFLAFLPQFTDPTVAFRVWAQLLILGTIVNVMFSSADVVCVLMSTKVMALMNRSQSANRLAHRFGGTLLVGLGINLAVSRQ
ncbi:MAG: LysE family translocator [Rhizobiaceae bacterium]